MKACLRSLAVICLLLLMGACHRSVHRQETMQLPLAEYTDRVHAMWLAQMIAVHEGWDFEHAPAAIADVQGYSPRRLQAIADNGAALVDDDWYYEMVALWGFERYGIGMTTDQLGQQWLDYNVGTWGSAFYTRQALLAGIPGSEAGLPRNNRMWFTVGNQNRSDLYAMLTPGMPNSTAALSRRLGHVNSYAEGTDGGVLISVLESMAFYEHDIHTLVRNALTVLAPESPHRLCGEAIIAMAENGATWQQCMQYVEERWGIEYPATNSAVWNAGFALVALWFGEGDLMKSMNIAWKASDFSDADCQAANVATIIAAMHGTRCLPEQMVFPFNNRMKGTHLGFMELHEPIDISLTSLTERTVAIGLEMLQQHGAIISDSIITIPIQRSIITQEAETFHPDEFASMWNPRWQLSRAGYGAPGGGLRGIRGGTFIDDSILVTYPRDEARGVRLMQTVRLDSQPALHLRVAADPGRQWMLTVYADHDRIFRKVIDGGAPIPWEINAEDYPQPLIEYQECSRHRLWQDITIDLTPYAGKETTIRLFQSILVRNGFPGNAYWAMADIIGVGENTTNDTSLQ